jgi:uncharacterized protein DUF6126
MTTPDVSPSAHAPVPGPDDVTPVVRRTTNGTERRKERGVTFRVLIYVVVAHVMAFYLFLMFAVIGKN